MGFTQFHHASTGKLIYINPAHVVAFQEYQNRTAVPGDGVVISCAVACSDEYFEPVVSESLDEVAEALG